jgi:polysaccharide chain length determinant protein (PEP-CTERM system associated)
MNAIQEAPISVPRRALDIEDYIEILRRHRGWILGFAFLGLVVGVVTAYLWPDSYRAAGTIRLVPPQVPNKLISTNVSQDMADRINTVYQNILQRPYLTSLIKQHNLYPDDVKRLPMEDVVEKMRKDIAVGRPQILAAIGGRDRGAAFEVSYSYEDRRLARAVCQQLVAFFVDDSNRARSAQSVATTEFLKDQFEVTKRALEEIDKKILDFKMRNVSNLPEQEQGLIGRMNALEGTIGNTNASISRANQEKMQMETNLRLLREQYASVAQASPAAPAGAVGGPRRNEQLMDLEREITRLEATLAQLRESYTDDHPDVARVTGMLASKRKQRDQVLEAAEAARSAAPAGTPQQRAMSVSPEQQERLREINAAIARAQAAIQAKDNEIEVLTQSISSTRRMINGLQSKLEFSPVVQQEYTQLMRDREVAKERYDDMQGKLQMSAMGTDVEVRKFGETLEIMEEPMMPNEPYSPKRPIIVIGALVAGLALGAVFAAVRELKDTSLKNLKDVRAYTRLTVLGSIPLLENDFVVRRRRRLHWLAWAAVLIVGILLMSGSVAYYYTSKA